MTDEELAAIRARAEAATPGPWAPFGKQVIDSNQLFVLQGLGDHVYQDADFIAHAREDIPKLLAEIKRLRTHPTLEQIDDFLYGVDNHAQGLLAMWVDDGCPPDGDPEKEPGAVRWGETYY